MKTENPTVIVAGARTPVGRLMGALSGLSAAELGGLAISGALEKAGVNASDIDHVIMGQVLTAGAGQLPARQAADAASIPMNVPALTINKVCLSGINAVMLADQMIRCGDARIVVAGGQESMSRAPHLLPGMRPGVKYGDSAVVDHVSHDGLYDVFTHRSMGELTDRANTGDTFVSREEQDEFAAQSHQRAASAWENGVFDDEVVRVPVLGRKGNVSYVESDEGIRAGTTAETLGRLRPVFSAEGTITAGSASQVSDGAAAMVLMPRTVARELGLTWIAEIRSAASVAGPDSTLQDQPANAITAACTGLGVDPADLDLVEINEAFAAVGVNSARRLGISADRVNVNGGAISIGHPLGMSGARILLHLALELQRRGGGTGAAGICGGTGQGDAVVITAPGS